MSNSVKLIVSSRNKFTKCKLIKRIYGRNVKSVESLGSISRICSLRGTLISSDSRTTCWATVSRRRRWERRGTCASNFVRDETEISSLSAHDESGLIFLLGRMYISVSSIRLSGCRECGRRDACYWHCARAFKKYNTVFYRKAIGTTNMVVVHILYIYIIHSISDSIHCRWTCEKSRKHSKH